MAPIIYIPDMGEFERTKKYLDLHDVNYSTDFKSVNINTNKASDKYIEVPSCGLLVPKEKTLFNYTSAEAQAELFSQNKKTLSFYEFTEFAKEAKRQDKDFYKKLINKTDKWEGEWLDAKFVGVGKNMRIIYHTFENGQIVEKSEKLDQNTLRQNISPGISLESWIKNPTPQGLPKQSVQSGETYWWAPENNTVAGFDSYPDRVSLSARALPSWRNSDVGVRAAEQLR